MAVLKPRLLPILFLAPFLVYFRGFLPLSEHHHHHGSTATRQFNTDQDIPQLETKVAEPFGRPVDIVSRHVSNNLTNRITIPSVGWDKAISRGARLDCYAVMTREDMDAAQDWGIQPSFGYQMGSQSEFYHYQQMTDYGWESRNLPDGTVEAVLKSLNQDIDVFDSPENKGAIGIQTAHMRGTTVNYKSRSKNFQATRAVFHAIYSCARGFLILIYKKGVRAAAPSDWTEDQIVPLNAMSDVMFLEWERECRHSGFSKSSSLYWIEYNVRDPDTLKIINRVVEERGTGSNDQGSAEATLTPDALTRDHFLALLGSNGGLPVGRFVSQHKKDLGIKQVNEISVYRRTSGGGYHLLFQIETLGRTGGPYCADPADQERYRRHGHFRAIDQATWERAKEKGNSVKGYFSKSIRELDQCSWPRNPVTGEKRTSQSEYDEVSDLRTWGWLLDEYPGWWADIADSEVTEMLGDLEIDVRIPSGGEGAEEGGWYAWKTTQSEAVIIQHPARKELKATDAILEGAYNVNVGLIFIRAFLSPGAARRRWREDQYTPLRFMSDIVYLSWIAARDSAARIGKETHPIEWVFQDDVMNDVSTGIATKCTQMFGTYDTHPLWPGEVFRANDQGRRGECYSALLGSPNGLLVGYMLVQHTEALGQGEVESIRIVDSNWIFHIRWK